MYSFLIRPFVFNYGVALNGVYPGYVQTQSVPENHCYVTIGSLRNWPLVNGKFAFAEE